MNVKCSLIKLGDKWCSANTWKYAWAGLVVKGSVGYGGRLTQSFSNIVQYKISYFTLAA
jgi:hypothetical protein